MKQRKATIEIGIGEDVKYYTFEFDRETIVYLEKVIGFNMGALVEGRQYHTESMNLWCGGLQKNHGLLSMEDRLQLRDQYVSEGGDLGEIMSFLLDVYENFLPATQLDSQGKPQKPTKKAKFN